MQSVAGRCESEKAGCTAGRKGHKKQGDMAEKTKDLRRILLCVIGGTLYAVNLRTFVNSGGLLPSGFSGLSLFIISVVQRFAGITLPYSVLYIGLNLFPGILAYKKIGKKFTVYSGIAILVIAVLSDVIPAYTITQDPLLIAVFGGLINGFAVSLCLHARATSGGTDFIAIYFSEKYGIDAWNYVLYFNVFILICNGFLFGWDSALYSMIFQFVSTQVLHTTFKRYKKNTLFIVTDVPEAIAMIINEMTSHGATQMDVIGTYRETKRRMLYSVIDNEKLDSVVKMIRKADPNAFINVMRTEAVAGRFYMMPND